jgi:hypothetical protein
VNGASDCELADRARKADALFEALTPSFCEPGQLLCRHDRRPKGRVQEVIEQLVGDGTLFSHETKLPAGSPKACRSRSHAVSAEKTLFVGQLCLALHEETGPADELARLLRQHTEGAFTTVLRIGGFLFLVLLVVCDD